MNRKDFIKATLITTLTGTAMKLNALNKIVEHYDETDKMPVLFVGHGNPMNAIEDNVFSREMKRMGTELPKPKAILMVSAHWEKQGPAPEKSRVVKMKLIFTFPLLPNQWHPLVHLFLATKK